MWKPAGSYAMTAVCCPGGCPRERPSAAVAGSRDGPLPAGLWKRIPGKEIIWLDRRGGDSTDMPIWVEGLSAPR